MTSFKSHTDIHFSKVDILCEDSNFNGLRYKSKFVDQIDKSYLADIINTRKADSAIPVGKERIRSIYILELTTGYQKIIKCNRSGKPRKCPPVIIFFNAITVISCKFTGAVFSCYPSKY